MTLLARSDASPVLNCLNGFGIGRLLLLFTFLALAAVTYLHIDAHTMQAFLLMVKGDPWGAAHLWVASYALSVVLLFPCMIMQMISGALYGLWPGLLMSWIATCVGQSAAFLLGRYLFRASVKTYLHNTWPGFPAIDAAIKRDAWRLVCLLRLSPVLPYNVLNYALALTPVSFLVFSTASSISSIPWTCLYVYIGTLSTDLMALARGEISYNSEMHVTTTVLTLVLVVVSSVYGYVLSHRAILAVMSGSTDAAAAAPSQQELWDLDGGESGGAGTGGGGAEQDELLAGSNSPRPVGRAAGGQEGGVIADAVRTAVGYSSALSLRVAAL